MTPIYRFSLRLLAVILLVVLVKPGITLSQTTDEEKLSKVEGKVDGVTDRVTELENTLSGIAKLKISGYIQPQWQWQDIDSLGNQVNNRNAFTIRRGRIKFVHKTGSIGYTLYPDITENGVVMKEVFADWYATKQLTFTMGAMNRPFGYEIAYSSSAREVTERSLFENRFFNGERDLGLQIAYNPKFGDISPLLEVGLFNGSDNFGTGPSGALPGGNNKFGFGFAPIGQSIPTPKGADSLLQLSILNAVVGQEPALQLTSGSGLPGGTGNTSITNPVTGKATSQAVIGQPGKELIGHLRLPFLLSDEFSFDVGASYEMGGITEPSNMIGKYTGTNGGLVLANSGTLAGHTFNNQNHTFLPSNRSILGVDAQIYLSVLPFGGSILKFELYSGQTPFYGSAALFSHADSLAFGTPVASTIYKKISGMYVQLVQNLSDMLQLAARFETFDPNTEVKGTNFATKDGSGTITKLRGVAANSNFGGDLAVNTISVDVNVFISGSMRLMLDWDHPITESFTRVDPAVATNIQTVADTHDDRFTFRMQYKF